METTLTQTRKWNTPAHVAFRFVFTYFVIYIIPFPIHWIPYAGFLVQPFSKLFFASTESFGRLVFDTAYVLPPETTGSGDTMHHYVQLLLILLLSAAITMVWSVLDRKRHNYETLRYWFMILLRYYLAAVMLRYGFSKVLRLQFPPLTMDQLNKPYGESSPMNLLWTFMGYSGPYSVFTGLGEVVGGLLLLFRRTRLLGALVVSIVMSHVVMLNFAYDVPVKLFSTHLLLIALLIMTPDVRRLLSLFVLNQTANAEIARPLYNTERKKWIYFAGKSIILICLVSMTLVNNLNQREAIKEYFTRTQSNSFDGVYDVETFILNNDTLPPVQGDTRRWKRMVIKGTKIELQSMDDASMSWYFVGNLGYRRMIIHSPDLATSGQFKINADSVRFAVEGILNNDSLKVVATKKPGIAYLLVSRGFHWVNEYPYNR